MSTTNTGNDAMPVEHHDSQSLVSETLTAIRLGSHILGAQLLILAAGVMAAIALVVGFSYGFGGLLWLRGVRHVYSWQPSDQTIGIFSQSSDEPSTVFMIGLSYAPYVLIPSLGILLLIMVLGYVGMSDNETTKDTQTPQS